MQFPFGLFGGKQPLSALCSNFGPTGSVNSPGTAVSNNCTITPSGGTAPYTYAWTQDSFTGAAPHPGISNSTSNSVTWSASGSLTVKTGTWHCVVTDAALATVTISGVVVELDYN